MDIINLPDKWLKIMVTKMVTRLEKAVDKLSDNFNKDRNYKKKCQI